MSNNKCQYELDLNELDDLIQGDVIDNLNRCFNEGKDIKTTSRFMKMVLNLAIDKKSFAELYHRKLQPYYRIYLTRYFGSRNPTEMAAMQFLNDSIQHYDMLGYWVNQIGFKQLMEEVAQHEVTGEHFFKFLRLLNTHGYRPYITSWPRKELEDEIERITVTGNRNRSEYLCIMMSFLLIELSDETDASKLNLEALLEEHWRFLRHVYSVMVKHIIGSRLPNYPAVANNVAQMTDHYPYLHLFYQAVLLREEDLFATEEEKDKMVRHLINMQDIMKNEPQMHDLDRLCSIIFGADFERVIQRKSVLSYDDLAEKIKDYEDTIAKMERLVDLLTLKLKKALEECVPIEVIEQQLLKLPFGAALDVYNRLNTLLVLEPVWIQNSSAILQKIMAKNEASTRLLVRDQPLAAPEEIEEEEEDTPTIDLLMPIFKNKRHEVKLFLKTIDGQKGQAITEHVNQLLRDGKITHSGCKATLWEILHNNGLYPYSKTNWNKQVN